jgi:hypothetical protein
LPASKTVSAQLAPGLVFLVVGCKATPTLQSGANPGTLLGNLIGFTSLNVPNAVMVNGATWSFGTLPPTFPSPTYAAPATPAPLVFLSP